MQLNISVLHQTCSIATCSITGLTGGNFCYFNVENTPCNFPKLLKPTLKTAAKNKRYRYLIITICSDKKQLDSRQCLFGMVLVLCQVTKRVSSNLGQPH